MLHKLRTIWPWKGQLFDVILASSAILDALEPSGPPPEAQEKREEERTVAGGPGARRHFADSKVDDDISASDWSEALHHAAKRSFWRGSTRTQTILVSNRPTLIAISRSAGVGALRWCMSTVGGAVVMHRVRACRLATGV